MTKNNIHPTAIIETGAQIGENVTIEAYAVIKKNVKLENGVVIKSHVYIDGYTTIGENTVIFPFTSIGTKPQALRYQGEITYVKIGKNCEIREFVTINSSIKAGAFVQIGDHCLIMASCHIAHNSTLGNRVIMGNGAAIAGHVVIEDNGIIGGMTPVHQFVRIGTYAMVGGMSRVGHDIPPYTLGAGIPFKFGGINLIGLKRQGFSLETRQELSRAFKIMYREKLHFEEALKRIESELKQIPEIKKWIAFCRSSKRGIMGLQGVASGMNESDYEFLEEGAEEVQEFEECTHR
jgi:UDP-N-acetylglucosamine acyltransferase